MPGPPPPPPAPPMMAPLKKAFVPPAPSKGGGDINALLGQIQKGKTLKKVQTVDKSAPLVAGRVAGAPAPSPSRSRGAPAPSSAKTSPDSPSQSSAPAVRPPGGFTNIADELQYKMTLKKNKNSPVKEVKSVVEPKETTPPALSTPSNSFLNEIKAKQGVASAHQTLSQAPSISDAFANKSSLFNKPQVGGVPTVLNPPKIINHGKPNLAPKPPPQLKLVTSGNNSFNGDSNRKSVARHQSMKSPRSPPVAVSPAGPFNSDNHFGTVRMNPSSLHKFQEVMNSQSPVQKPAAQRPTNKPPPPPVPNRFPNTNLSNNHAKSTNALNLSSIEQSLSVSRPRLPNSGSSNNISSMEKSLDVSDSSAPPLPPHRVGSQSHVRAPPTPAPPTVALNSAPPDVPRRHSSMRNSIENGANVKYPTSNSNTKLVVDLESRYSLLFHNVSEFPAPRAFMNLEKSYPSRAIRQSVNGI